jgi:hypothetical protein
LLFSWHFSLNNGTLTSEQRERERERGNGNEASPSPAPSSIIAHWLVGSGRSNAVSALCNNNDIGRTYQNTREYYHAFAKRERTGARIKSEKISREKEKEQTREEKTERKKEKKKKRVRKKTILPHLNRRK